ncbi:MAG TPA: hypothetical protein VK934_02710, partial [Fimbriimonas sp.]|nr:hypothetical protein [Fimbriimonas sp.]
MKNLSFGKIAILSTIVGGSLISETGSAQNVDWISVYQHPDARVNMGLFLQRDSGGNLFVGGQIKRDAAITVDVLVQKYNSVGGLLWNFWIDSDYDIATGMGLDSSSNVVVSGILDDSAAPDPSKHRATVLSLDSAGAYRYGFWLTNGRNAGVAVEPGGSFVTVGSDVAPKSGRLRKYNSAGTSLWTKVYSLPAYDVVDGVGVSEDTAGNIYALMNAHRIDDGSWEMKTIKYSPAGVRLWVNSIASGRWNTGVKILARPSGGCVVIGSSTVEGTFDG